MCLAVQGAIKCIYNVCIGLHMWGPTMWAKRDYVCVSLFRDFVCVCVCVCVCVAVQRAVMYACMSLFRGLCIHVYDLGSCDVCVCSGGCNMCVCVLGDVICVCVCSGGCNMCVFVLGDVICVCVCVFWGM